MVKFIQWFQNKHNLARLGYWTLFLITLPLCWIVPFNEWNSKFFEKL